MNESQNCTDEDNLRQNRIGVLQSVDDGGRLLFMILRQYTQKLTYANFIQSKYQIPKQCTRTYNLFDYRMDSCKPKSSVPEIDYLR